MFVFHAERTANGSRGRTNVPNARVLSRSISAEIAAARSKTHNTMQIVLSTNNAQLQCDTQTRAQRNGRGRVRFPDHERTAAVNGTDVPRREKSNSRLRSVTHTKANAHGTHAHTRASKRDNAQNGGPIPAQTRGTLFRCGESRNKSNQHKRAGFTPHALCVRMATRVTFRRHGNESSAD